MDCADADCDGATDGACDTGEAGVCAAVATRAGLPCDDGDPCSVGETCELGLCLGTVFGYYDDDGDQDLYVVNDFGRKTLYRNDGVEGGVPRFRDVTVETGTLAYGAGMSASFGDYDNDLDLDIYIAHIRSEHGWFAEWPTVLRYMMNTWRQGVWVTDMPLLNVMFQRGLMVVARRGLWIVSVKLGTDLLYL